MEKVNEQANYTERIAWPLRLAKLLIPLGFLTGIVLSLKTAYDLLGYSNRFPSWFVPVLISCITYLVSLSAYMAYRIWTKQNFAALLSKKMTLVLWLLVPLSFICATSLHSFLPFRPGASVYMAKYPIYRINFAISIAGIVLSSVLAVIYFRGHKVAAITLLTALNFLVLIPNDNCGNPFNAWWNTNIGASPLVYLPCFFVVLFICCALLRIHTIFNLLSAAGMCVLVFLLGLGHMTGFIW